MTNEQTIEVPAKWLEGLLLVSKKLDTNKINVNLGVEFDFETLGDLEHLLGYIESAKYLLEQNQ